MKITFEFSEFELGQLIREKLTRDGDLKDGKVFTVQFQPRNSTVVCIAEVSEDRGSYLDR